MLPREAVSRGRERALEARRVLLEAMSVHLRVLSKRRECF
jgi:hypothetical protein